MDKILFVVPTPLAQGEINTLSKNALDILLGAKAIITEKAKTTRRLLKSIDQSINIDEIDWYELNKHARFENSKILQAFFSPHKEVILVSECGTPAVADPGNKIVEFARKIGYRIKPIEGPNSILMALMASGLNGQSFSFHGYLPIDQLPLIKKIEYLDMLVDKSRQTQIFMETPYRLVKLIQTLIKHINPKRKLVVALNLTMPDEEIIALDVVQWRQLGDTIERLNKKAGVLILG